MLSLNVYKLLHLAAVFLAMAAVGAVALHALNGGTRSDNRGRRLLAITHGAAAFVILVTGFGMLARLGLAREAFGQGWIWVKLAVWILLGAALTLPYRWPQHARLLFFLAPLLGLIAGAMALYKPF